MVAVGYASMFVVGTARANISEDVLRSQTPLKISFNKEVKLSSLPSFSPSIDGSWHTKRGIFGVREVYFTPEKEWPAGENVHVLVGFSLYIKNEPQFENLQFDTKPSVEIDRFRIKNGTCEKLPALPEIEVALSPEYAALPITLSVEETKNSFIRKSSGNPALFVLEHPLVNSDTATLRVVSGEKILFSRECSTVVGPDVVSLPKKDYFLPGDTIEVVFNTALSMDPMPISTNAPGEGRFVTDSQYNFTLGTIAPGEEYFFLIPAGAKTLSGGTRATEKKIKISTPGELHAVINIPTEEVTTTPDVKVVFDQPVDHTSAESHFLINPKARGNFSWEDNTMIWHGQDLAFATTYTVSVGSGVLSLYGLPSTESVSGKFTTVLRTTKLPITFASSYSGDIVAIMSAMSAKRMEVDEDTVFARLGPASGDRSGDIWGDPRLGFVGSKDSPASYGSHASVIARAVTSLGRKGVLITHPSVKSIANEILAGNPVIVLSGTGTQSWVTSSGTTITALTNKKTLLVGGVYGGVSPRAFYVYYPGTSGYTYVTAEALSEILQKVPGITDTVVSVK